jgi:hypothetical protein
MMPKFCDKIVYSFILDRLTTDTVSGMLFVALLSDVAVGIMRVN